MNGPEIELAGAEQLGDAAGLRPGERKIEFLGDALFEHVEVFGQRQDRLHHVQTMHFGRIDGTQALGQKISLLLIVAFDVDAVKRADNRFEQSHGILRPDDLAAADDLRRRGKTLVGIALDRIPCAGSIVIDHRLKSP